MNNSLSLGQIPHLELAERRAAGAEAAEVVQEEERESSVLTAYGSESTLSSR